MINFINSMGSKALLDILMMSMDATAIYTGPELTIQLANDAMLKLWGKDRSIRGQRFEDALPEMKGQPFPELLKSVWRTGETYEARDTAATLEINGKLVTSYFDFVYRAIKDENENIICILHSAKDVSARIIAWEMVAQKEAREKEINEELHTANEQLSVLNEEYQASNEQYHALNEEYQATNEELNASNEEFAALNEEFQVTNEELSLANEELNASRTVLKDANLKLDALNAALHLDNVQLAAETKGTLALLADAPIAIALLDVKDYRIISANAYALKLWDKDISILGKRLAEVLPELGEQHFIHNVNKALSEQTVIYSDSERVLLPKSGELTPYYFNIVYKPVFGADGSVSAVMVVASDVSEQTMAAQVVSESRDRLSLALSTGKLGSYELDLSTHKMICSDQCKANFGKAATDRFDFADLMESILPSFRNDVQKNIEDAIKLHELYEAEYQARLPDGSVRWIHASGKANYDGTGKPLTMTGVTRDVTMQKHYEQRQDDFLTVASHELKTPITVLKANFQLLERMKDSISPQIAVKLIESAGNSLEKFNVMINELLDVTRHREGKLKLNKSKFNIGHLLKGCCDHVRLAGSHELIIRTPDIMVYADEHRIDQVLVNLVNNAVKYSPAGTAIFITGEKRNDLVRISVKDQGNGIKAEQIPHLFDRLWQAADQSTEYNGLGMGLYISSEIIQRHGGKMGVESELGKGSEFWFEIPLA
ncbi:ATP-binding protein [Pedobacter jeongneungensis]|uniref:ATP-binding protein n=1 Tax=Pedobacter jeongneungensis TaxID=947309 RepID=UPI0004687CA2|nr:ATP-binding protein [Pedobacter jeongneungensis]